MHLNLVKTLSNTNRHHDTARRPLRGWVKSLAVAATLLAVSGTAFAQDEEPAEDQAAAATGDFESRFRWGITGGAGPMVGGYSGFGLGVNARVGMQLSQMLGVYAQPVAMVAVGAQADYDNADVTAAALYGVGALGDITLGDIFFVAAGPELLLGGVGSSGVVVNPDGSTATVEASTGPYFAIAARAGVVLGSKKPTRRSGFSIGLDMQVVFAGDALILPLIYLGYERF